MKAAIIGTGRMGQRHGQVVGDLGLDLVGLCDQSEDNLSLACKELELDQTLAFMSAADLLATARPEVVIVATTAPSHAELAIMAARAGAKYILCEKPMAVSLEQADRMIAACDEAGAKLAVNHQMRFMEQYTRIKELFASEELGGLASVNVVAGNFGLAMNGSHYFEMFRYLTDQDPVSAQAWFSDEVVPNPRGPQFEDRAGQVRLETADGRRFHMDIGSDQGEGMTVTYGGRNGWVFVDELTGYTRRLVRLAEHRHQPTTRYGMPWEEIEERITPADAVAPTRSVLEALINGADYPDGRIGRLAVACLVAAYESAEKSHRPVAVGDNLPQDRVFPWA